MVGLGEIPGAEDSQCPARTRAVILQKRFQELIANIIKDTQKTFSSLMDDLDRGAKPVKKLPRFLPQTTDRFHCQVARKLWTLPKSGDTNGEGWSGDGCFDALPISSADIAGSSCSQNRRCSSDSASFSTSNMDRDEYEASERLKRLIEEELRFRRHETVKDHNNMLYLSNSRRELITATTSGIILQDENPTSSQRLDSLIKDELDRMKISSTDAPKDNELQRIDPHGDDVTEVDPLQSRLTRHSPVNSSGLSKNRANILRTKVPWQSVEANNHFENVNSDI